MKSTPSPIHCSRPKQKTFSAALVVAVVAGFVPLNAFAFEGWPYGSTKVGQPRSRPAAPVVQDAAFVRSLYRDLLRRDTRPGEVESWINAVRQGMSHQEVIASIVESDEHRGVLVQSYYSQFLGRRALPGEGSDWVDRLREGYSRQDVIKGFIQSEEFMQRTNGNPRGFIDLCFRSILKRPPTAQDHANWMNRLSFENIHETLPNALLNSQEYCQNLINDYSTAYLHRRPGVAANMLAAQQWLEFLMSGGNPEQLQIGLLASHEYYNLALRLVPDNRPRPRL